MNASHRAVLALAAGISCSLAGTAWLVLAAQQLSSPTVLRTDSAQGTFFLGMGIALATVGAWGLRPLPISGSWPIPGVPMRIYEILAAGVLSFSWLTGLWTLMVGEPIYGYKGSPAAHAGRDGSVFLAVKLLMIATGLIAALFFAVWARCRKLLDEAK